MELYDTYQASKKLKISRETIRQRANKLGIRNFKSNKRLFNEDELQRIKDFKKRNDFADILGFEISTDLAVIHNRHRLLQIPDHPGMEVGRGEFDVTQ